MKYTMTPEESDIYEHELYAIEIKEYEEWSETPSFFRFYRNYSDIEQFEVEGCLLSPIHKIHKTCILSRVALYTKQEYANEEIARLKASGIECRMRKVDIRLKG